MKSPDVRTHIESTEHQESERLLVKNASRRQFLTRGGLLAGGFLGTSFLAKAFAATCGLTPPQTKGPFYPESGINEDETDLTRVPGSTTRAKGDVVRIVGKVVGADCNPIAGANVEIWQACASGRYNHSKDPNTSAALDRNFRYWGETSTDADGEYSFTTIIPGAYPADTNWWRPPHVHFRVSKVGYKELITQMYFKGQALNDKDLILQDLSREEQERVVVEFVNGADSVVTGAPTGRFDITLESVRANRL
jgi:protocatechuate 3,4-dioxygenase beta subunit